MEELLTKIKERIDLSPEAEAHLLSISSQKAFRKDAILIREGQEVKTVFFVQKGCLRSYCTDQLGKEHTLQFAISGWWISDYLAIHTQEQANLNVECLQDSIVIQFQAADLDAMLHAFPEFEPFQRRLLERHLVSLQKRILNQLQLTAAERYELFLSQYGDIEQYTRNYHIASYLGITQQSLSRIRFEKLKR